MKLAYHQDTDSLYIDLSEHPSVESREISEGIVLDYDAEGHLVGIDIDNASRKVQLQRLVLSGLAADVERRAGLRGFAADGPSGIMVVRLARGVPAGRRPSHDGTGARS